MLQSKSIKQYNRKWLIGEISIPGKNSSEDDIFEYLGHIASTCSGLKLNREQAIRRGIACKTEAANDTPSKVYEYLPSFWETGNNKYHNLREKIKSGAYQKDISFYSAWRNQAKLGFFNHFHVFECRVPQFVWTHIATHRSLSPLKRSVRMGKEEEFDFWLPEFEINKETNPNYKEHFEGILEECSKKDFKYYAKSRYSRKEIYNRWPSEFRLVDFMICGYKPDFENFFAERGEDTGTQKETQNFAKKLKEVIYDNNIHH